MLDWIRFVLTAGLVLAGLFLLLSAGFAAARLKLVPLQATPYFTALLMKVTLPATMDYQFTITAIDSTGTETVTMTDSVTVTAVDPADALEVLMLVLAIDAEKCSRN